MVSVNTDGRVHASFIETFPGTAFPQIRFWPYFEGQKELVVLRKALALIRDNIFRKNHNCQRYFKTLPLGRGFDDIFGDANVWINYDDQTSVSFLGATSVQQTPAVTEITLNAGTFGRGHWVVAATIIHELAHVNGVPGGAGMSAEDSLKHCGMAAHWSADAVGVLEAYNEFYGTVV